MPNDLVEWVSFLANLVTACSFVLIFKQLRFQRKEQKSQALTRLFDEVVTSEFRRKLQFIYSRGPNDLVRQKLSQPEIDIVEEVTAVFDGIGFRVRKDIFPRQETLELFWDLVLRCAQRLRQHIVDQRDRRGEKELPDEYRYKYDFDWLTRECKLFHFKMLGYKPLSQGMEDFEIPPLTSGNPCKEIEDVLRKLSLDEFLEKYLYLEPLEIF